MARYPLIGITAYETVIHQHPTMRMAGAVSEYKDAILAAGGLPVLIPQNLDDDQLDDLFEKLDGILLPGGGDINPDCYQQSAHETTMRIDDKRDDFEIRLTRRAVDADKPLLAICRGHQVLNVALGGTLWQNVETQLPNAVPHDFYARGAEWTHLPHTVRVAAGSKLASLLGTLETEVNSFHHQAIQTVGEGLTVTAYSPDESVEAIELPGHRFAVGVQWHPEHLTACVPAMQGLFRGLIEAI